VTVSNELSKYRLDLVGVQEVRWEGGGTEPAGELYLAKSTNHEAPRYAVSTTSRHFIPLRSKYLPQHPFSNVLSLCPPLVHSVYTI
jgi:hypothetical protein